MNFPNLESLVFFHRDDGFAPSRLKTRPRCRLAIRLQNFTVVKCRFAHVADLDVLVDQ